MSKKFEKRFTKAPKPLHKELKKLARKIKREVKALDTNKYLVVTNLRLVLLNMRDYAMESIEKGQDDKQLLIDYSIGGLVEMFFANYFNPKKYEIKRVLNKSENLSDINPNVEDNRIAYSVGRKQTKGSVFDADEWSEKKLLKKIKTKNI
jgi:hypothetical protein